MVRTPTLETERLILRPVVISDAPAIQKYFNNWNIIKHLTTAVPWPYPDNGAEDFINKICLPEIKASNFLVWVLISKQGPDEAIGIIHFRHKIVSDGNRGFWIAEPFQGRGLMTEAVTAVQDYLFFDLGLEKIIVANAKDNPKSRRIKEKTGSIFLGEFELLHHSGEKIAEKWMVTRENWAKIRGKSI